METLQSKWTGYCEFAGVVPAPGDEGAITLGELIMRLETAAAVDPEACMEVGLTTPQSYRGFYVALAFAPGMSTVGEALEAAKAVLGTDMPADVEGGRVPVTAETRCYVASEGWTHGPFANNNSQAWSDNETAALTASRLLASLRNG